MHERSVRAAVNAAIRDWKDPRLEGLRFSFGSRVAFDRASDTVSLPRRLTNAELSKLNSVLLQRTGYRLGRELGVVVHSDAAAEALASLNSLTEGALRQLRARYPRDGGLRLDAHAVSDAIGADSGRAFTIEARADGRGLSFVFNPALTDDAQMRTATDIVTELFRR